MTERDELAELLARATEIEGQVAEVDAELADEDLTPDARADLEAQRQANALGLPEIQARIEELADQVQALVTSVPAGTDPAVDEEANELDDDWDDEDEVDGEAELNDADDGTGFDFEEADDAPVAEPTAPAAPEAEAAVPAPEPALAGAEAKAWQKCERCGSEKADEYEDGSARCEDCGELLLELKRFEPPADPEPEADLETLSEFEILRARREALQQ